MADATDTIIAQALISARRIAVVGFSPDPSRPSHAVAGFLHDRGYDVLAVNPGHAGKIGFGHPIAADLASVQGPVDMVDIFRRPDQVLPVVQMALAAFPALKTIWMQIGVVHPEAAALARARDVAVIADRCPKIEYLRLFGTAARATLSGG